MVIPFEKDYRKRYYELIDSIFDSNMWTEGAMTREFERVFGEYVQLGARAISSGGAALLAILEYIGVNGCEVIVPDNTFWATTQAVKLTGGRPVLADCNRYDLCLSADDVKRQITSETKAVIVVHIGGHIAFDIDKIAALCKENNIYLIEDCAHVHGGWWNGKTGGHYGFAGAYSFYATKTMPTGDGGMVVSRDREFLDWVEKYRNYGKEVVNGTVSYPLKNGFNYRISEFAAALGVLQTERLPCILEWKRNLAKKYDEIFDRRVYFPDGMESGYYKYIVFDTLLKEKTGQVFGPGDLGSVIMGCETPENSKWVTEHHSCAPMYFGWANAALGTDDLRKVLL
jgi:dTDP-4-amino-4,6-dideoxygalactose transaminase